jgi:hypothetical protein
MGLCQSCRRLKPVAICVEDLTIGTVQDINTTYNIFFKSLANGFTIKYTAISDNDGLLILSPSNGFILAQNHLYEMYVNKTTSMSSGEPLDIDGVVADCFQVMFTSVNDEDGVYAYIQQTLEIA